MDRSNLVMEDSAHLISEGWFDKLFRKFKIKDKSLQSKIKKDKKLGGAVKDLNRATKSMEDYLKKATGNKKIKLQKFSPLDFFL